jgi:hypothetical protein
VLSLNDRYLPPGAPECTGKRLAGLSSADDNGVESFSIHIMLPLQVGRSKLSPLTTDHYNPLMCRSVLLLAILAVFVSCAARSAPTSEYDRAVDEARKRWAESPHGSLLERILPPTFEPAQLPQRQSRGARLLVQYCVQCHNLPSPAMHASDKWPGIVERMVLRMQGKGNLGPVMHEMMGGVAAPTKEETKILVVYLRDHAQTAIDPALYPDLERPSGQSFKLACGQCHVLPDPTRHTASEWPQIVARMERNMAWMNRVVANVSDPRAPELRVDEIVAFLQKHAARR